MEKFKKFLMNYLETSFVLFLLASYMIPFVYFCETNVWEPMLIYFITVPMGFAYLETYHL